MKLDMEEMGKPRNSLFMAAGEGPFGSIFMGGMFTIVKIRENLRSYDEDPGWYRHPAGTVASAVESRHASVSGHGATGSLATGLPAGTFDAVRLSACGAGRGGR